MTNMGHKKSQMKMTQGTNARQSAFSKRRSSLFKKASELCTLCAVETALVIFSPGGNASSFGHANAEIIMNKLAPTGKPDFCSSQLTQTEREATLDALNKEYHDLLQQLEAEKKRGKKLEQMRMERQSQGKCWVDTPIDELNLTELLTLKALLEEFQVKLRKHMEERSAQSSAPTLSSAAKSAKAIDPSAVDPAVDLNSHGIGPGK